MPTVRGLDKDGNVLEAGPTGKFEPVHYDPPIFAELLREGGHKSWPEFKDQSYWTMQVYRPVHPAWQHLVVKPGDPADQQSDTEDQAEVTPELETATEENT